MPKVLQSPRSGCFQKYAKDPNNCTLNVLLSKISEELKTEKSRVEDLEYSLQRSERENDTLRKRLELINYNLKCYQSESDVLEEELETYNVNVCDSRSTHKMHQFQKEFGELRHEVGSTRLNAFKQLFNDILESERHTIMELEKDIEHRDRKLNGLEDRLKDEVGNISILRQELKHKEERLAETNNRLQLALTVSVNSQVKTNPKRWHKDKKKTKRVNIQQNKHTPERIHRKVHTLMQPKPRRKVIVEQTETSYHPKRKICRYDLKPIGLDPSGSTNNTEKDKIETGFLESEKQLSKFWDNCQHALNKSNEEEKDIDVAEIEEYPETIKIKYQQQKTLAKLKETEAELVEIKFEKDLERHTRLQFEQRVNEYEILNKQSKDENDKMLTLQQEKIQNLKKEIQIKDLKLKAVEDLIITRRHGISDRNKHKLYLKETEDQLSDLRIRLQHSEDVLAKVKSEREDDLNIKNEMEKRADEYENCIKRLEGENMAQVTSLNQRIQSLEREAERRESELKCLQKSLANTSRDISEKAKLEKMVQKNMDQLDELRCQNSHTIAKLNDTETLLDNAKHEKQFEQQTRQELELKMKECENCIKYLNEANQQEVITHRQEIQNLKKESEHKDRNIKDFVSKIAVITHEISDKNQLRKDLKDTVEQFSVLRNQQQQTLAKPKGTEAKLSKAESEKQERDQQTRQELENIINKFQNRITGLKQVHDQEVKFQQNRIQHLENENYHKDCKLEDLQKSLEYAKSKISGSNQLMKDLKNASEELYELKNLQKQNTAKLEKSEAKLVETISEKELERRIRQKLERKTSEYEHRIKKTKDENAEIMASQILRINQLEREITGKDQEVKALQDSLDNMKHDVRDRNKVRKDLKDSEDQLSKLRNHLQQVVTKLKITEKTLEKTKSERDQEVLKKSEFESQICEWENRTKQLEEANEEVVTSLKQRIQFLENEVLHTNQKIKDVQENAKRGVGESNQLMKDLKEARNELSELKDLQKRNLAKLKESEAKLAETISEKEFEKCNRQKLERKTSEYEHCMKQSNEENDEKIASQKQRINQLEREIKGKNQEVKVLHASLDDIKHDNSDRNKVRKDFKDTEDQLSEMKIRLKQVVTKLKTTEDKLEKITSERDQEMLNKRSEFERQVSECENRTKHLEEANKKVVTSLKERIQFLENETERTDRNMKDFQQAFENAKREVGESNQLMKDLQEAKEELSELKNLQKQNTAKLKESETKLVETMSEKEFEKRCRQKLERKTSEYEHRIKKSKDENAEIMASQNQRINQLEREIKGKHQEVKALQDSLDKMKHDISDRNKVRKDLKDTEDELSKLRNHLQQNVTKLKTAEENLEKTKSEFESQVCEWENRTKQLEKTNEEVVTSLKQKIQFLENEALRTNQKVTDLQKSFENAKRKVGESNQLVDELKEARAELSEFKDLQKRNLAKLKESEAKLAERISEKELENLNRQKLERKITECEHRMKKSKNENDEIMMSQKHRINQLEREIKGKNQEVKALHASLDDIKQDISDRNKVRKDLKDTEDQLSEMKIHLQQIITKLRTTEDKLEKVTSERDQETLKRSDSERQVFECDSRIKHLEEANKKVVTSLKERIQFLENEAERTDRKMKDLLESFENAKREVGVSNQLMKDVNEAREELSELTNQQNQNLAKLKESEAKLVETMSEIEYEKRCRQTLERKIGEYEHRMKQSKDENDEIMRSQKQRINQLEREIKGKHQEVTALRDSLDNMKHDISDRNKVRKDLNDTEDQLSEMRHYLQQVVTELKRTGDKLEKTTSERDHEMLKRAELEKQLSVFEKRTKNLEIANEKIVTSQKQRLHFLEKEARRTEQKIKDLQESLENAKREVGEINQLRKDLKDTKDKLSELRNQQNQTLDKLNKSVAKVDETNYKKDLQNKGDTLADLKDQLQQALTKVKETESELDETKTRLSKAMGDKLTDNNPNIADLSDKNRPIKLAERYAELYDNQWTESYDILEKNLDREQYIIEVLLETLQDVMHFCEANAIKQLEDLQSVLGFSNSVETRDFPADVHKHLKDCRKKMSSTAMKRLYEMYLAYLKRSAPQTLKTAKEISAFVKECLEICWLMAIQDPPVVFAPVAKSGSALNTDIFKPYTSSGTHVEYTVWPALLLHEGGPVLAKGVAQGYGKKPGTTKLIRQEKV